MRASPIKERARFFEHLVPEEVGHDALWHGAILTNEEYGAYGFYWTE